MYKLKWDGFFEQYIYVSYETRKLINGIAAKCPQFDIYLGGGYLRDEFVSKGPAEPKDIDIFFIPKEGTETQSAPLISAEGMFVQYHKAAYLISDMEDRGVYELTGLYCHRLKTQSVQFIVYKRPMTQEQLVDDMDMGINQVMLKANTSRAMVSGKFLYDHAAHRIECYHVYDLGRMHHRYESMQGKFPTYTAYGKPDKPVRMVSGPSGCSYSCSVEVDDDWEEF